jgi:FKBP-type peptidyl-prolyl cis-trans isomerase
MKFKFLLFLTIAAPVCFGQADNKSGQTDNKSAFKDQRSKTSYSAGVNIGTTWKAQDIDLDLDMVLKGLRDAISGTPTISQQEALETLRAYQTELKTKHEEKRKVLAEKNKIDSEKFLEENKTKPGVKTMASGLQYKVLTEGNGPMPPTNCMVTVHYKGSLIGGTEFDNSYERKEPSQFDIKGVIKGWTEALQNMKVGSKWQIFIPPHLAYGEAGRGTRIPPNAALIFEMELLAFTPHAAPPLPEPVTSDIIKVPSAEGLKRGEQIEIIKQDQLKKEQEKELEKQKKDNQPK